jgi:hypothetical protein
MNEDDRINEEMMFLMPFRKFCNEDDRQLRNVYVDIIHEDESREMCTCMWVLNMKMMRAGRNVYVNVIDEDERSEDRNVFV